MQLEIFKYILGFAKENPGHMPTYREIIGATAIKSTSHVKYSLHRLVEYGFLELKKLER